MRVLLAAAALALAWTPATAQDSNYEFETKVIQLPAGARPHDAAPGRPGEIWGAESGVDKILVIRTAP